jgi:hypothetical protein
MWKEKGETGEVVLFTQKRFDFKKGMKDKSKNVYNYCKQFGQLI